MTDEKMTQGRFVTNLALAKVSGYIDDNKDEFLQKIADNVYPLVDSILAGAEQQVEHEVKKQIKILIKYKTYFIALAILRPHLKNLFGASTASRASWSNKVLK